MSAFQCFRRNFKDLLPWLLALGFSLGSVAQELAPLPKAPANPIKNVADPKLGCAELGAEMDKVRSMMREHHQAVGSFVDEVAGIVNRWHQDLVKLEGVTQTIPKGQFSPLKESADEFDLVLTLVYDNADILDNRLAEIQAAMLKCLK